MKLKRMRKAIGRRIHLILLRSYYGRLELSQLVEAGISEDIAREVFESLVAQNISTKGGKC
jgi:hypothetical protein